MFIDVRTTRIVLVQHVYAHGDRFNIPGNSQYGLPQYGLPRRSYTAVHQYPVSVDNICGSCCFRARVAVIARNVT